MTARPYANGKKNKEMTDALTKVLATSFVLYGKTHSFHWNVTGPLFHSLHVMFEEQYTDMWQALDEIAERIRALDAYAPGTMKEMLALSELKEQGQIPDQEEMIKTLAADNESLCNVLHKAMEKAEENGDTATADLLNGRLHVHEKNAWMLRSTLKSA